MRKQEEMDKCSQARSHSEGSMDLPEDNTFCGCLKLCPNTEQGQFE